MRHEVSIGLLALAGLFGCGPAAEDNGAQVASDTTTGGASSAAGAAAGGASNAGAPGHAGSATTLQGGNSSAAGSGSADSGGSLNNGGSSSGGSGSSSGGSSNGGSFSKGGSSSGGTSSGGSAGKGGSSSGGTSNNGGSAGKGGSSNNGGSAGKGGSSSGGSSNGGSSSGGSSSGGSAGQTGGAGAPAGWTLSWSDEFNGTGLVNSADWVYEVGKVRNGEAQYYTNAKTANARQENGMLVIEALKETVGDSSYTSASITTRGKHTFLYGRLDIRAKIPIGRGTWPAIWLLATTGSWPKAGEIDIMENVGFEPNLVHATIHTGADPSGNNNKVVTLEGLKDNFYVYSLEWTANQLDWYIDGTKIYTYTNDGMNNLDTWPYSKPFFLLLNLAIGGNWGGQQGIDDTLFPHRYYIDYVRYYTKP
jgi:beta-glucanase (GH16 family)